jgi:hypothetical protein
MLMRILAVLLLALMALSAAEPILPKGEVQALSEEAGLEAPVVDALLAAPVRAFQRGRVSAVTVDGQASALAFVALPGSERLAVGQRQQIARSQAALRARHALLVDALVERYRDEGIPEDDLRRVATSPRLGTVSGRLGTGLRQAVRNLDDGVAVLVWLPADGRKLVEQALPPKAHINHIRASALRDDARRAMAAKDFEGALELLHKAQTLGFGALQLRLDVVDCFRGLDRKDEALVLARDLWDQGGVDLPIADLERLAAALLALGDEAMSATVYGAVVERLETQPPLP